MFPKWKAEFKSSLLAAQQKLIAARDANDKKAEVEALTSISQLGYEQAKVAELKTKQEMEKKVAAEKPKEQVTTLSNQQHKHHLIQEQRIGLVKMTGLVKIMP